MFGKTPKISKHHLPLSCKKNKRNQPPLNHNNSVELEPSNTKNRFINTLMMPEVIPPVSHTFLVRSPTTPAQRKGIT